MAESSKKRDRRRSPSRTAKSSRTAKVRAERVKDTKRDMRSSGRRGPTGG